MGLETAPYIHQLITTNPEQEDLRRQGDDHLRTIKQALLNTFPEIKGPVLATHEELNLLRGRTSLPEVVTFTVTPTLGSTLNPAEARVITATVVGVRTTDVLMPLLGVQYSQFPGLLLVSWRPLTDAVELNFFNAGTTGVPAGSDIAFQLAAVR
jgi:hypothetical protein